MMRSRSSFLLAVATVFPLHGEAVAQSAISVKQVLESRVLSLPKGQLIEGCVLSVKLIEPSPLRKEQLVESLMLDGQSSGTIDVSLGGYQGEVAQGDCFVIRVKGPTAFRYGGTGAWGLVVGEVVGRVFLADTPTPSAAALDPVLPDVLDVDDYFRGQKGQGDRIFWLRGRLGEIAETKNHREIYFELHSGNGCQVSAHYRLSDINRQDGQADVVRSLNEGDIALLQGRFMVEVPCHAVFFVAQIKRDLNQ